jgi:hypothetical protein
MHYWPLIILALCLLGISWFAGSDAPYVPTKMDLIRKVLKKAGVKKGTTFYELGSGDGRVVYEAALQGAVAHGIEQSWLRVLYSRWKAKRLGLTYATFSHGNIFKKTYFEADVTYAYLLQPAIDRLEDKLKKEIPKGAHVITQRYHFKTWKPTYKIGDIWIYTK